VLVDCHSRFEANAAPLVAEELARLDVGWLEEPMEPTTDAAGLVEVAGKVGMPVAGGESGYGESFFEDLVRRRAVRIVMPDIKHCGGVAEACRAGRAATAAGGQVSLHCPSGPVSLLASAHVTAAIPGALPLEHAVEEAPWRAELLDPPECIEGGRLWLLAGIGVGAKLSAEVVSRYGRAWRP
jgi:galactonate dehydratase